MLEVLLEGKSFVEIVNATDEQQAEEMDIYPEWPYYNEFSPDYMCD